MNARLYADLEAAIEQWLDTALEEDAVIPSMLFGETTVNRMATAAASVFDAVHEIQTFMEKEGYAK